MIMESKSPGPQGRGFPVPEWGFGRRKDTVQPSAGGAKAGAKAAAGAAGDENQLTKEKKTSIMK